MKIFTNKAFENELCKARGEIEERYYKQREFEEQRKRVWELENRIERLEAMINKDKPKPIEGYGECVTNKTCVPLA